MGLDDSSNLTQDTACTLATLQNNIVRGVLGGSLACQKPNINQFCNAKRKHHKQTMGLVGQYSNVRLSLCNDRNSLFKVKYDLLATNFALEQTEWFNRGVK